MFVFIDLRHLNMQWPFFQSSGIFVNVCLRLWDNYFYSWNKFLDSLMDKRLSFPLKRCGFESRSISFFSSFFLFCKFVRLYSWFCVHMDIFFLNLAYVYPTNTHVETWIISMSRNVITLCTLGEFNTFVVICWLFSKYFFQKHLSGTLSECQTVCIQIRTHVLLVLIWEQTVCKGYQQTTKVAANKKRVRKPGK